MFGDETFGDETFDNEMYGDEDDEDKAICQKRIT